MTFSLVLICFGVSWEFSQVRELQSSTCRNFRLRDARSANFMEIALQIVQELTKKSRLLSKALRVGYVNPQTAFHMIKAKRRNLVETNPSITGFRFCGMEVLSSVFSLPRCGECGDFSLLCMEDNLKRKGCASTLRLLCEQCGWKHSFCTSKKQGRVFK